MVGRQGVAGRQLVESWGNQGVACLGRAVGRTAQSGHGCSPAL